MLRNIRLSSSYRSLFCSNSACINLNRVGGRQISFSIVRSLASTSHHSLVHTSERSPSKKKTSFTDLRHNLLRNGCTVSSILTSPLFTNNTSKFQISRRYASSSSSAVSQSSSSGYVFPEGYIPEPPLPPEIIEAVPQLNALGEPTLSSIGLGGWWPSGLVQQGLEALHVGLGVPWWEAIIIGTIIIRLCLFPLVIKSQKYMTNMNNHMPVIQRLQERVTIARIGGNQMEAMQATMELQDYMKRNEVSLFKSMMMPIIQMPIFLSVFFGLRAMAELPVDSMRSSGTLWFPDLTVPDPFWGLPILTATTLLATIEIGSDTVRAGSMSPAMRWAMRAMPAMVLIFTLNFPSAMCVYWLTANIMSLLQALTLRVPSVRKYFGIPDMVKHPPNLAGKKKGFVEGFRDSMDNSKLLAKVQDRERIEATKFREAGMGPIQKTYSYDPTKVKAKEQKKK